MWLWSRQQGVFSHQTALVLHELSDTQPSKNHVTLPSAWRPRRIRPPASTVLHHADLDADARAGLGPIPVTTPLRTIEDASADSLEIPWIVQACKAGTRKGLFSAAEANRAIARGQARNSS